MEAQGADTDCIELEMQNYEEDRDCNLLRATKHQMAAFEAMRAFIRRHRVCEKSFDVGVPLFYWEWYHWVEDEEIKKNYNFPLTLTASMTRSLSNEEFESIGKPKEWGVLSVRPMGATIRMTKDKRILIRNTAEVHNPLKMSKINLDKRSFKQKIGIKKRFPQLPDDIIQSSWSGIVSRTRNSSQIFEKIDNNVFVAGCYNGSGIGVGTLFGEQIAIKASNEYSKEIETIEARNKTTWLPPQPFLDIGIKSRLIYERFRAKNEI